MEIKVKRIAKKVGYTIGKLYVNGKYFCDTLEDTDRGLRADMSEEEIRERKVYGRTAIPTGTYKVSVTYSNAFRRFLPLIHQVKGFNGIRIHAGNTPEDTLGCILVGENKVVGKVINSKNTFNKLFPLISDAKVARLIIE